MDLLYRMLQCFLSLPTLGVCSKTTVEPIPMSTAACSTLPGQLPNAYYQGGYNADHIAHGFGIYSDSTCSTLLGVMTNPTGCFWGFCGDSEPLPVLPTVGYTRYETQDCSLDPFVFGPETILFTPSACGGSQTYSCEQKDGVDYGVLVSYSDPSQSGLCTSGNATTVVLPAGKCEKGMVFLCDSESQASAKIANW